MERPNLEFYSMNSQFGAPVEVARFAVMLEGRIRRAAAILRANKTYCSDGECLFCRALDEMEGIKVNGKATPNPNAD